MAILHADGFSHYGANPTQAAAQAAMTSDGYSEVDNVDILPNSGAIYPENGDGCMLHFWRIQGTLIKPVSPVGANAGQIGLYFQTLTNNRYWGYHFSGAGETNFLNFIFADDGSILVSTNPDGTVAAAIIGKTPASAYKAGTWQDWEFAYWPDTGGGVGKVALYLGGVLVLQINGLAIATAVTSHGIGAPFITGGAAGMFGSNWIINDTSGAAGNTVPLGPRRTNTRIVSANGTNNAWVAHGAASQWQCVSKVGPDTSSYIEAVNPGDLQDFVVPASSHVINAVTSVLLKAYMQKSIAGVATCRLGIQSGLTLGNSPELAPGVGYAFWNSGFFDVDPNTLAAWSVAAYNAIGVRASRVQ